MANSSCPVQDDSVGSSLVNHSIGVTMSDRFVTEAASVHSYWFGGSVASLYRTKWFPDGSTDGQRKTDAEISSDFRHLLKAGLNGELFSWLPTPSSGDRFIGDLSFNEKETEIAVRQFLDRSVDASHKKTELSKSVVDDFVVPSISSAVALIVVLDQFSRHIYRHDVIDANSPLRVYTDGLALQVASWLKTNFPEQCGKLSTAEYVFSLMPMRHTKSLEHYSTVIDALDARDAEQDKQNELMARFRKQTVRRLQSLQDRAKLESTSGVLEFEGFDGDDALLITQPLSRIVETYFKSYLRAAPDACYSNAAGEKCSKPDEIVAIVSLSGGVDSMVLMKIICALRNAGRLPRTLRVLALHVDYGNRPESSDEAAFVSSWATSVGATCLVRRITEATRGITARDEYEKLTREIRYGLYSSAISCALEGKTLSGPELSIYTPAAPIESEISTSPDRAIWVSGVLFGHHLGDVQENVVSNVMRGVSPLALSGMTATSVTNGVRIWRPLLPVDKTPVLAVAHKFGVPYLKDSTPSWSTRGKLRNHLLPLLSEIYGDGCLQNLARLAGESDALAELVDRNLYAPFMSAVQHVSTGVSVNIMKWRDQPTAFWRESLKLLMHLQGMGLIRDKAVATFCERLERPGDLLLSGWLEIRRGYHAYLTPEGQLTVLRDGVLRRNLVTTNPRTTRNQRLQKDGVSADVAAVSVNEAFLDEHSSDIATVSVSLSNANELSTLKVNGSHWYNVSQRDFDDADEEFYADFVSNEEECPFLQTSHLKVGPWDIEVTLNEITSDLTPFTSLLTKMTGSTQKPRLNLPPLFQSVSELLASELSYEVQIPVIGGHNTVELILLRDLCDVLDRVAPREAGKLFHAGESPLNGLLAATCMDMRAMDIRLRDGLPLLVPLVPTPVLRNLPEDTTIMGDWKMAKLRVTLRYANQHI